MPSLEQYTHRLHAIWERQWLTNDGELHKELELRLAEHLGVEHLSLFCNGTVALMVALQALGITSGEVITTPFTFPATPHVLYWNRIQPVFCDIDEKTFNLDPDRIEALINSDTKAILAVHVYGTPCDVEAIQTIANRHGLRVIYDAAHAFGVRYKDQSVLTYGDASVLSFHATKLFTTGEGGAAISKSEAQKRHIDNLKNFGIADEETVIGPGVNGKMNELQAALGLLQLDMVDEEIAKRGTLSKTYRDGLKDIPGISFLEQMPLVHPNHSYFPILIDGNRYGILSTVLKRFNIYPRKYFYPLCSRFPCYSMLPSAAPSNLPVAERVAQQVLCLPIYGSLDKGTAETICGVLRELHDATLGA
jgi:dTDP-4-amino-4,6-dideoxygalactose transaminase